jgi:hypothetical protein
MTRSIRRGALAVAALAVSISAAPAAHAAPGVCNQASPHWLGGGLVALDPPVDSPAARYTTDLGKLPGKGGGLVGAAAHSPSLTLCDGGGSEVVTPGDSSGTPTDGGDGGAGTPTDGGNGGAGTPTDGGNGGSGTPTDGGDGGAGGAAS